MRTYLTLLMIGVFSLGLIPGVQATEPATPAVCQVEAVDKRMNALKQKNTDAELKYKARFDAKLEELGRLKGWTNAQIGEQAAAYFATPEHKSLQEQKKPYSRRIYSIFEARGPSTTMSCSHAEQMLAAFRDMWKLDEKQWKLAIKNVDADIAKAKKVQK
jgi:hypothetical protein